jgi:uncharacterized membrane protein YeaQ/YmgE (transglycosylase-associated protein family)
MDFISVLINLVSGGVGGNIAGAGLKDKSLGMIGNTIAGAIGGTAGAWIIKALGVLSSFGLTDMSMGSIIGAVGTSAVSGGVITAIVAMIKDRMK